MLIASCTPCCRPVHPHTLPSPPRRLIVCLSAALTRFGQHSSFESARNPSKSSKSGISLMESIGTPSSDTPSDNVLSTHTNPEFSKVPEDDHQALHAEGCFKVTYVVIQVFESSLCRNKIVNYRIQGEHQLRRHTSSHYANIAAQQLKYVRP
jgi:hypothetical protein